MLWVVILLSVSQLNKLLNKKKRIAIIQSIKKVLEHEPLRKINWSLCLDLIGYTINGLRIYNLPNSYINFQYGGQTGLIKRKF